MFYAKIKTRHLLAATMLAALSSPAFAAEQTIEIDPGLYAYSTGVVVNGQSMLNDDYEYCLEPEDTKMTLSEIVAELEDLGSCEITNINVGDSQGEADFSCYMEDMGMTSTGHLKADYTSTDYKVVTDGKIGGMLTARATVTARRLGDCPAGWTPPEGYSKD